MRSQRNRFSSNNHSFLPLPFPPTNFPISSNQTTMFNLLRSTSTRVASSSSSSMLLATAVAGPSRISIVGRVGASSSSSSACSPPSLKRSYHEKVLDHYNKPRNVSVFHRLSGWGIGREGEKGRKGVVLNLPPFDFRSVR